MITGNVNVITVNRLETESKPEEDRLSLYEVQVCNSAQHRPSGLWATLYALTTLEAVTLYARMQDNDFENLSLGASSVFLVRSGEGPVSGRRIEKYEVRREYAAEVMA